MKTIAAMLLFIFLSLRCFSQSLEGEWKGSFTTDFDIIEFPNPIKLYFVLNKDSSYTVYSYSLGQDDKRRDTIIVCKVLYNKISEDSLYLEEIQVLKPINKTQTCFQKMYLKIKRKENSIMLEGTWESEKECYSSGKIRFTKKG